MPRPRKQKEICGFEGCENLQIARKLCAKHYARWLRYGDPSIVNPTGLPVGARPPLHQKCSVGGCLLLGPFVKGFCQTHYDRFKRHGDPLAGKPKSGVITTRSSIAACKSDGCDNVAVAKGFCNAHWYRFRRYGDPQSLRPIRKVMPGVRKYNDRGYLAHWDINNKAIIYEHRSVMAEFLGRPLCKNESVHHKNGNKADNRLENLELWVTSQPYGQRPLDLIEWARSILKIYEPEEERLKELEYRNQ